MELRHLAAFVAVAEEGTFTRAGDRLHIAQSAVSAAVRTLERELGTPLFERTPRGARLSDAGRLALVPARQTLANAAATRDVIDELRGGLLGTVRLGILASQIAQGLSVPDLIETFGAKYPGVDVELHDGVGPAHAADLRAGRLDIAYLCVRPASNPALEVTPLVALTMQLCCRADHPLAARAHVELDDLVDEPFVDIPTTWGLRGAIDRAFDGAGVRRNVRYEVPDIGTLLEFVRRGLGVAVSHPLYVAGREPLRTIPIRRHAPVFTTSIATAAGRDLSAAAAALRETAVRLATEAQSPAR
jgi:DNA-binding transcriptional LysR family regulator